MNSSYAKRIMSLLSPLSHASQVPGPATYKTDKSARPKKLTIPSVAGQQVEKPDKPVSAVREFVTSVKKNHPTEVQWVEDHFWRYLLKSLIMFICITGCGYQCISIIRMYFRFPTTVYVYVHAMEKLNLPGITLCNGNRLVMSKLRSYNKTFDDLWAKFDDDVDHQDDAGLKLVSFFP